MRLGQIKYYSTNLKAPEVSFREALLSGLAPDGGLYMPSMIPPIRREVIDSFSSKEYHEIAADVLKCFLKNEIDDDSLRGLCRDAYNFCVPIEKISDEKYILRLDQGPTASFKDFAARMMARLMNFFISSERSRYTILTATSGDTGSAVANAFHGLENIEVIILFPAGEVSEMQRKQMTALKGNITVLAVDGKFDDCQKLVKRAFLDPSLANLQLASANSINAGRLLPQAVYYFYAWSRLNEKPGRQLIFSVPSGNFGNLTGGFLAREMGLPVSRFIASTNSNDEVPQYLKTGIYAIIDPSHNCISSAMNVGHPGNLARIVAIYGGVMDEKGNIVKEPDMERMRRDLSGFSVSDDETRKTIAECYRKYSVLLEPHGAVAWKGIELYDEESVSGNSENPLFIVLETAHPAKFTDEINRVLGFSPPLPHALKALEGKSEKFENISSSYDNFADYLRNH